MQAPLTLGVDDFQHSSPSLAPLAPLQYTPLLDLLRTTSSQRTNSIATAVDSCSLRGSLRTSGLAVQKSSSKTFKSGSKSAVRDWDANGRQIRVILSCNFYVNRNSPAASLRYRHRQFFVRCGRHW